MPLPKPRPTENQKDFISRCMTEIQGEFPNQEQRLAVCYTQWKDGAK